MSDKQNFVDAIIAEPGDDTHRLVYADWLEEHEEPDQATLIRHQIRIARSASRLSGLESEAELLLSDLESEVELLLSKAKAWKWLPGNGIIPKPREKRVLRGEVEVIANDCDQPDVVFHFIRGFVEYIECWAELWIKHAEIIISQHPIRKVTLWDIPEWTTTPDDSFVQCMGNPKYQIPAQSGARTEDRFDLLRITFWPKIDFDLPDSE